MCSVQFFDSGGGNGGAGVRVSLRSVPFRREIV